MKLKKYLLLIFLFTVFTALSTENSSANSFKNIQNTVNPEEGYRQGRLSNGLTYYIKNLPGVKSINLRLYVKTGSYMEKPEHLQFAHIIEHLAFKPTKHFSINPKLSDSIRNRYNLKRGDVFGSTSKRSTSYGFNIPFASEGALNVALLWFRDIADLDLKTKDIENEKGVVRQERIFRSGSDLQETTMKKNLKARIFPCQNDYSDYFDHMKTFDPKDLLQFYSKWYKPNNMGVVVVGNIHNMDLIEKQIISNFKDLPTEVNNSLLTKDCRITYLKSSKKYIAIERKQNNDPTDIKTVEWNLFFRNKKNKETDHSIIWNFIQKTINSRMQTNAFYNAYLIPPTIYNPYFQINIPVLSNDPKQKLKEVIEILKQLKFHGITTTEWDRIKKTIAINQIDDKSISYWISRISDHYINNLPLLLKKSDITREKINNFLRDNLTLNPDDIGLIAPTGHKALSYTGSEIRQFIRLSIKDSTLPYSSSPQRIIEPIMSKAEISSLKDIKIISSKESTFGFKSYLLNNGIRVILHPYIFSGALKGRISIHAYSPFGANCFSQKDYFSAINSPSIIQTTGVGEMDSEQLKKSLENRSFGRNIRPYVNYNETGFRINGSREDLEEMLQFTFLYFNKPRYDKTAFESWKTMERLRYLKPSYSLEIMDFNGAIAKFYNDKSWTSTATSRFYGIDSTKVERAFEIFDELYGHPSRFTFIVSGDFSSHDTLSVKLLSKYLGNLSNRRKSISRNCIKDKKNIHRQNSPLQTISTSQMRTSYEMKSVLYYCNFLVNKTVPMNWKEAIKVQALRELINSKLQNLRFKKGAALYEFSALAGYNNYLMTYNVGAFLNCSKEELDWLRNEVKIIIQNVKKQEISTERFNLILSDFLYPLYLRKSHTQTSPQQLYEHLRYGHPLVTQKEVERFINSLTTDDIRKTANKYLRESYMTEFIMKK